ncbi:TOMM precursor leader peptide-binding protein [Actinocatenispora rupis]|nr:TOMM precursor leader peptide-binding protein [Actinocatenispora rupis]
MKRPLLLPGVPRLQRDRSTVQVGVNPDNAVVVRGDRPALAKVLNLFDGTRSEAVVRREASQLGLAETDVTRLLHMLTARGLVRDASSLLPRQLTPGTRRRLEPEAAALALRLPDQVSPARVLGRRQRARVLLVGRSRMAAPLGALLAASGVGHVHPTGAGTVVGTDPAVGGVLPDDTRRPYRRAVCDAILRAAPDTDTRTIDGPDADLVVLLGRPRPVPAGLYGPVLRRVRHLTVWVRDGSIVVGPLVRPGRTSCLHCVEMARQDRDPSWPVLAAQLATMPEPPAEPVEASLAALAVATAAAQALAELDGDEPAVLDGALEISPPGMIRRRAWPVHPRCDCLDRRRR